MVLGMAVTRLLATDPHAHDPAGPGGSSTRDSGSSSGSSRGGAVWAVLAAWLVFGVLTALHVWANVRAMRSLVLRSLNQPRLELLVTRWEDRFGRVGVVGAVGAVGAVGFGDGAGGAVGAVGALGAVEVERVARAVGRWGVCFEPQLPICQ